MIHTARSQTLPIPDIALSDTDKLLIDWFLFLVSHTKEPVEDLRFSPGFTYRDIHERLALIHPQRVIPSVKDINGPLSTAALLAPDVILAVIKNRLALSVADPSFPWCDAEGCGYPAGEKAFNLPWTIREELRFATNTYQPVPWAKDLPSIDGHYVHLATINCSHVAFTPSPEKGERDIQTSMRPGRYLTRYYPDLDDERIRRYAALIEKPATLKFAVTADDIETVYLNGPNSCMTKDPEDYESPCHPVRVYGDSDLQLAYAEGDDGHPVARCLVWPEKKRYGRAYGDQTLICRLLEREGFTEGTFCGARIRRISAGQKRGVERVVMPYIDNAGSFDICADENFLVIGGDCAANGTDGIGHLEELTTCAHCDDHIPQGEAFTVGDEDWCESCYDHNSFESDYSNNRFPDSVSTDVIVSYIDGKLTRQDWAENEAEEHATWCQGSERYFATDNFEFVILKNGDVWEKRTFEERGDPGDLLDPPANDAASLAHEVAA